MPNMKEPLSTRLLALLSLWLGFCWQSAFGFRPLFSGSASRGTWKRSSSSPSALLVEREMAAVPPSPAGEPTTPLAAPVLDLEGEAAPKTTLIEEGALHLREYPGGLSVPWTKFEEQREAWWNGIVNSRSPDVVSALVEQTRAVGETALKSVPNPTRKLEAFRHQKNLDKLYQTQFKSSSDGKTVSVSREALSPFVCDEAEDVLVLVNGVVRPELSALSSASEFYLGSLGGAGDEIVSVLEREGLLSFIPEWTNFDQLRDYEDSYPVFDRKKFDHGMAKFAALNLACASDAAVLRVNPGVKVENPLQILHVAVAPEESDAETLPTASHPRVILSMGEGAQARVVHSSVSISSSSSSAAAAEGETPKGGLVNGATVVGMGEGAELKLDVLQELEEGRGWWHWEQMAVRNAPKASVSICEILRGSESSRLNTQIDSPGECRQELSSLIMAGGRQQLTACQMIHHRKGGGTTEQLHKNVMADRGDACWRGRVRIEHGADQTACAQMCRTLTVNPGTKATVIPSLEILTDDVTATHGATVSDIPEAEVFYLTSRGIPRGAARYMLLQGFVEDIARGLTDKRAEKRVMEKLDRMAPDVLSGAAGR